MAHGNMVDRKLPSSSVPIHNASGDYTTGVSEFISEKIKEEIVHARALYNEICDRIGMPSKPSKTKKKQTNTKKIILK